MLAMTTVKGTYKMKIVVLEKSIVGEDIDISSFEQYGEVTYYENTTYDQVGEHIQDAEIVILNKSRIHEETIGSCPNIKLICEFATGYDNIDIEYCKQRGILVCNVKDYSTEAVAQHTFALYFYVAEKLRYYDDYVKSKAYQNQDKFSNFDLPFHELDQKTWGIIGMGMIGQKVASIATAFGCNVIYYSASGAHDHPVYERVSFEELLSRADVLSVHAPLSDRTRHLMNYEAFAKMKKSAVFINVARGPIVKDEDLYQALVDEKIMAAGLDVIGKEPMDPNNPLGMFNDSNRLIITPHLAWASVEARTRLVHETCKNIQAFLDHNPINVVNPV